jgi:hypothetical protein
LSFERESEEPVRFAIGGEEALAFGEAGLVDRVPFDYGVHDYVLFVGEFPMERVYFPVVVRSRVLGREAKPERNSPPGRGSAGMGPVGRLARTTFPSDRQSDRWQPASR